MKNSWYPFLCLDFKLSIDKFSDQNFQRIFTHGFSFLKTFRAVFIVSKLWRIVQSKGLTWTSVYRLSSKLKLTIFFMWSTVLLNDRVLYERAKFLILHFFQVQIKQKRSKYEHDVEIYWSLFSLLIWRIQTEKQNWLNIVVGFFF